MSKYHVSIKWTRAKDEEFTDNKYSRGHTWLFDGGAIIPASSSPQLVPTPFSIEASVDPEEAFVASLSSCHMLWFLHLAAEDNYVVDRYADEAVGKMERNAEGKLAMTEVTLRPKIDFGDSAIPTVEQIRELHQLAHEKCFISNSVKTKVKIEPA